MNYDVACPSPIGLGQTRVLEAKGVSYTSAPLTTGMELTGHPAVHLWISSTAKDGNFFAYLEDIAPDGR